MLEDGQQAHEREPSVPHGENTAASLPNDLLVEVAKHLSTDDPVETSNNLTSFKLASHSVLASVDSSEVGTFQQRVKRLGTSSKALYDSAVPRNGFAEYPDFPEPDPTGEFALASQRIRAIGPVLKFQSPTRKTEIVNHILNASDGSQQGDALLSIAPWLHDLGKADQMRLINRAIEYFKEDGPINYDFRYNAAHTLAEVHDQLEIEQKAQIFDAIAKRPELGRLYAEEREHVQHSSSLASTSESPRERGGDHLAGDLAEIEEKIRAGLTLGTLSAHEQMERAKPIASSINKAYDDARANLIGSTRDRARSDVGR
ncbi:hypothetical protein G6L46_30385 [Agrobacterium rhizogenes]|uniref:hypothetical protein n=1 Tax=Rhizobium rhizogenes TaxID=359 RepID=UPI0015730BFC|nr:hypothetical protein [Rhizobium rhizogenes]NTF91478.1 hypothetical protein [Rhizobium rhizogenes]